MEAAAESAWEPERGEPPEEEVEPTDCTLANHGVDAGAAPAWTTIAGDSYLIYELKLGAQTTVATVEKRLPELAEAHQRPAPPAHTKLALGKALRAAQLGRPYNWAIIYLDHDETDTTNTRNLLGRLSKSDQLYTDSHSCGHGTAVAP